MRKRGRNGAWQKRPRRERKEEITMMLYPAMSDLSKHIPNRYMLVNVVAKRARQIAEAYEQENLPLDEKPVTMAIDEVADGTLDFHEFDWGGEE